MIRISLTFIALGLLLTGTPAIAHPGSGIAVDRDGNVYFIDTGSGVWKIDPDGNLTKLPAPAYHWLAFDSDSRLASVTLPSFPRGQSVVTRDPGDPRILVSSDFPITVGRDGSLYYPWSSSGQQLRIFRLTPSGQTTVLATLPEQRESWLNGIRAAADGSVYYTENNVIRRITPSGELTTAAEGFDPSGCGSIPEVTPAMGMHFRGLDVDADGTIYVAATGCGTVLKIRTDGNVTTIYRSENPWSPTAVASSGGNLYLLEYLHTPGDNRVEWLPQVKKISPDGTVTTLATIER
jgi:sugar lactone lactonase YvrE